MGAKDLRDAVIDSVRELDRQGYLLGSSGNVSVRTDDDTVLVTPSGLTYAELEAGDLRPMSWPRARRMLSVRSGGGCLLANHGMLAVGTDSAKAVDHTVVMEEVATAYCHALTIRPPNILNPEQVAEVAAKISGYGQVKTLKRKR